MLKDIQPHQVFPSHISRDRVFMRRYAMYLALKRLYRTGTINNYRKQYHKVAKIIGCSTCTLRSYMSWMKENGWAKIHDGKHFSLIARNKFLIRETGWKKLKRPSFYSFKKYRKYRDVLKMLEVLIIYENQQQQKNALRKKIVANEYYSEFKTSFEILNDAEQKRYIKSRKFDIEKLLRQHVELSEKKKVVDINFKKRFNSDITISRKGYGKLLKLSTAQASNRLRKLSELNLITDKPRFAEKPMTFAEYNTLELPSCFFWKEGNLIQRYTNIVSISESHILPTGFKK